MWTCDGIEGEREHVPVRVEDDERCVICGKAGPEYVHPSVARDIDESDIVNRFKFHPATEDTGPLHDQVRGYALEFALQIQELVPAGREKSTAITKIEEAMMWANAGIARNS